MEKIIIILLVMNINQLSSINWLAYKNNIDLNLENKKINSIQGIEYLTNLKELNLRNNQISNIQPIQKLSRLTSNCFNSKFRKSDES